MTTHRTSGSLPPQVIPLIAGAIVGEIIVFGGLCWFAWRMAADACASAGGRMALATCEGAGDVATPMLSLLGNAWGLALLGMAIVSVIGTFRFVAMAVRRASEAPVARP
jgi:hypothetical protein